MDDQHANPAVDRINYSQGSYAAYAVATQEADVEVWNTRCKRLEAVGRVEQTEKWWDVQD